MKKLNEKKALSYILLSFPIIRKVAYVIVLCTYVICVNISLSLFIIVIVSTCNRLVLLDTHHGTVGF